MTRRAVVGPVGTRRDRGALAPALTPAHGQDVAGADRSLRWETCSGHALTLPDGLTSCHRSSPGTFARGSRRIAAGDRNEAVRQAVDSAVHSRYRWPHGPPIARLRDFSNASGSWPRSM